jgi:hypothetical protein
VIDKLVACMYHVGKAKILAFGVFQVAQTFAFKMLEIGCNKFSWSMLL